MSEFYPESPVVKRKKVSFSEDVKEHDGLKPSTQLFELLVVHYIEIGGMTNIAQMTTFLTEKECSITIGVREELVSLAKDLLERLLNTPKNSPILPEGGGSNYKVPTIALPNIKHMFLVLCEEFKFQQSLRTSVNTSVSESTCASAGGG